MPIKTTFLKIGAAICIVAAYRFAAHGRTFQDNLCIGLACIALGVAVLLLWLGFRSKQPQRD